MKNNNKKGKNPEKKLLKKKLQQRLRIVKFI